MISGEISKESFDKKVSAKMNKGKQVDSFPGTGIKIGSGMETNEAKETSAGINMGEIAKDRDMNKLNLGDGRFGLEDRDVATKLLDKNFSPMIIRKYTRIGFPLFVSLICDENLDDLDNVVHDCIDFCRDNNILRNNIQSLRNFTGILSDTINTHYDKKKRGCVESISIILYADKLLLSSLQGDAMNFLACRMELYESLNLMAKI